MRTLEGIDTNRNYFVISPESIMLEDMRPLEGIDTLNLILLLFSIMWLEDMRTLEGIDTRKSVVLKSQCAG